MRKERAVLTLIKKKTESKEYVDHKRHRSKCVSDISDLLKKKYYLCMLKK